MTKEKGRLLAISTLVQVIFAFFDVFFGVMAYEVTKNFNIIILYVMVNVVVYALSILLIYRLLDKKLLIVLYRISFVLSLISISLIFTISATRVCMIFVTQIVLQISKVCYYMPHEVATMNKNSNSEMTKFLGLSSTLSLVAGFVGPIVSGSILDYSSYIVIFSVLAVMSVCCFVLSLNLQIVKEDSNKIGLINFINQSHKEKHIRLGYLAHLCFNLSNDGIIIELLPILIFLKTGTNFSVGIFASTASVISGVALLIYCYFNKNKKLAMIMCCIFQVVTSLSILIWSSKVVFFIYYFVKKIATKILSNGTSSTVFCLVNGTSVENCKLENFCVYNFYHFTGLLIACVTTLVIYNVMNNIVAITITLALFSLVQILSTTLLNKSDEQKQAKDNTP